MTPPKETPRPPIGVAEIVATNVLRLRTARGWSQAVLARHVRDQGLLSWQGSTVALVETGKKRADHLLEVAALCAALEVGIAELLAGPNDWPVRTDRSPIPLESLRLALDGQAVRPEIAALPDPAGRPVEEEARLARVLGLSVREFRAVVYDVYGSWFWESVRDRKAGLNPRHGHTDVEPATRGRRGHATRALLPALVARLEEDGMTEIWDRTRVPWDKHRRQLYELERARWTHEWIRQTGEVPTEEETTAMFGGYIADTDSRLGRADM